jgi:hypothetical protein
LESESSLPCSQHPTNADETQPKNTVYVEKRTERTRENTSAEIPNQKNERGSRNLQISIKELRQQSRKHGLYKGDKTYETQTGDSLFLCFAFGMFNHNSDRPCYQV